MAIDDRERLYLAVFDVFNDMAIEDLQVYLPQIVCGLIGHVPMSKTVQAFIAFFNSSTFDGKSSFLIIYILKFKLRSSIWTDEGACYDYT